MLTMKTVIYFLIGAKSVDVPTFRYDILLPNNIQLTTW